MNEIKGYINEEHWRAEIANKIVFSVEMIGINSDLCPKCQHIKIKHDNETGCMIDLKKTNSGRIHHSSFGMYCGCMWGYDNDVEG